MLECIYFMFKRKKRNSIFPESTPIFPSNNTKILPLSSKKNDNKESSCCSYSYFYGNCKKCNK